MTKTGVKKSKVRNHIQEMSSCKTVPLLEWLAPLSLLNHIFFLSNLNLSYWHILAPPIGYFDTIRPVWGSLLQNSIVNLVEYQSRCDSTTPEWHGLSPLFTVNACHIMPSQSFLHLPESQKWQDLFFSRTREITKCSTHLTKSIFFVFSNVTARFSIGRRLKDSKI